MSIDALKWAWNQRVGSTFGKTVLLAIADCADHTGFGFPSPEYIADRAEVSRATAFRWIRAFARADVLRRGKEARPNGAEVLAIRLLLDRTVDAEKLRQAFAGESHGETQEPCGEGLESHGETQEQSHGETPQSHSRDCDSLMAETVEPLSDPSKNLPPIGSFTEARPKKGKQAIEEPIGFRVFWEGYPNHQIMNRERAVKAFVALSDADRVKAADAVALYASDLTRLKRNAINAHRWLERRGFAEYTSGMRHAGAAKRVFVAEGTAQYRAWINFASIAYGTGTGVPYNWRCPGGAYAFSEWPLGGEGWLIPREHWVFVENGTTQAKRWLERIFEIRGSSGVPLQRGDHYRSHRLVAHGNASWGDREFRGFLVPSEWPPAKGEKAPKAGQQDQDLSEEDRREFTRN